MAKKINKHIIAPDKRQPTASGQAVVVHASESAIKATNGSSHPLSEGNKVVSAPSRRVQWKEAAAWVVKAHAGAWRRLADR